MFTKRITGLTVTSAVANPTFPGITAEELFIKVLDESFLATLRLIMCKRLPSEERIGIYCSKSSYTRNSYNEHSADVCLGAILQHRSVLKEDVRGILHIHNVCGDSDGNAATFEIIDQSVCALLPGHFTALPDVAGFIEQSAHTTARVFISEERRSVLICVENLDLKVWHLLQSLLPRYFPWYMQGNPLDEEETALLRSLTRRYAPEYIRRAEELAGRMDFRTAEIRAKLGRFERQLEQSSLEAVRRNIKHYEDIMDGLRQQLLGYYGELSAAREREAGLLSRVNSVGEDNELLDYVLCNKGIDIVRANNGVIEFIINTVISNFDPDLAEQALNRFGESFFYRHYQYGTTYENQEMTDERIQRLMRAIFLDEIMQLRVCAAYQMNCANGSVTAIRGFFFNEKTLADHIPNPHLQVYSCLGDNEALILEAMTRRDYVGAMVLCGSSAANINLAEANTGTLLMENIFANKVGNIIQMPDGSTATPLDAVKWLEQQDAQKEKEKEAAVHEQTDYTG